VCVCVCVCITITIIGKVGEPKCTHPALTRFRFVYGPQFFKSTEKTDKKPFIFNLYFNDSNDRPNQLSLIKIEFCVRPSMTNAQQYIHYCTYICNSARAVQLHAINIAIMGELEFPWHKTDRMHTEFIYLWIYDTYNVNNNMMFVCNVQTIATFSVLPICRWCTFLE